MKILEKWEDPTSGFRFRVYDHTDLPFPSVTSILGKWKWGDGGLEDWRAKVGAKVADKVCKVSADKGTVFHDLMEQYLKGNKPDVPAEFQSLYNETIAWVEKQGIVEVIGTEVDCYHPNYMYSCKIDAIVRTAKGIEIWDWKTGDMRTWDKEKKCPGAYDARKFVKAGEQLAANAEAYRVLTKKTERVILRVINPCIKTDKFETDVKYVHNDYLFRGFLHKMEAWKHENFNLLKNGFKRMGCSKVYKWPLELITKDFYEDYLKTKGGK